MDFNLTNQYHLIKYASLAYRSLQSQASCVASPLAQGAAPWGGCLSECVQVHLLRAAQEVVEEHPSPLQCLLVFADDDILQIDAAVQAGQGEDEVGLGHNYVQVDCISDYSWIGMRHETY